MPNKPKVLVSDKLSQVALDIFKDRGIDVDFNPELGKDPKRLKAVIHNYDGLAIRSATKVTQDLLSEATQLKVIGRAGIGVDNVDQKAATQRGIIVMNTPFGNSETTAEHAIALLFSIARQIPEANASMKSGRWEKSKFVGSELIGKTLGVIGCGNIGTGVCKRALGLMMKVIGYDPFLTEERAQKLGIKKVEFDEVLRHSDFISLHLPLNDKTRNMIDAEALAKTKKGVGIINCARGGIIDEKALYDALTSGQVAYAGLDVFEQEPPTDNPLLKLPNLVATPHLGASTAEAQVKVAQQVAEQMSDYLLSGAITNALNMPSISAEEAGRIKPWIALANHLGSFVGQITNEPIIAVNLLYNGQATTQNTNALTAVAIAGILKVANPEVNMVSAESVARERGIVVSSTNQTRTGIFESFMKLNIQTPRRTRSIVGTVFSDGKPRIIQIKGINLEAEFSRYMLYTTNKDAPGVVGVLGTILSNYDINIASFNLGRTSYGDNAIALLSVDTQIGEVTMKELEESGVFNQLKALEFETSQ
ncbi:MAG: phosphoglycerate dehydrogenase [Rhodobacteraceae bacterium]|nr:phosphoglycerate dehydrogenase [Paracoccaceae bacterium]